MSKRLITSLLAVAVAAAMLTAVSAFATASSTAPASAAKVRVVPIVMKDPGCHWFLVAGKAKTRLVVHGKTAFKNLDEAALIVKGKNYKARIAVGRKLTIAKRGVYHITMVHQAPDDNHLRLVVK